MEFKLGISSYFSIVYTQQYQISYLIHQTLADFKFGLCVNTILYNLQLLTSKLRKQQYGQTNLPKRRENSRIVRWHCVRTRQACKKGTVLRCNRLHNCKIVKAHEHHTQSCRDDNSVEQSTCNPQWEKKASIVANVIQHVFGATIRHFAHIIEGWKRAATMSTGRLRANSGSEGNSTELGSAKEKEKWVIDFNFAAC